MAQKTNFLAAFVALIAFVMRMSRLDYESLRGDESFSVMVARWDLGRLLDLLAATEAQPPLYHTLSHFWLQIAGESEFAVRFVSVFFGVLMVPATFAFVRILVKRCAWSSVGNKGGMRVFDESAGPPVASAALLASFFIAINPFLLWHSQDARSYTMLACLTTASIALSLSDLSKRWKWGGFIAVTYAAMLTHYTAFYVVLAENVAMVLLLLLERQDRLPGARRWLAAQALLVVAYLPWVWWAIEPITSHLPGWIEPVDLGSFLERTLVVQGVGTTIDAGSRSAALTIVMLVLILVLFALGRTVRTRLRWAFAVGVIYFVAPALFLFSFSLWRPMFDERHVIIVVPSFAAIAALGAVNLSVWRWAGIALMTVLVGALAFLSLENYFFDPQFAKSPGWRELASEIRTQEKSGDYIVLNFPDPTFSYYYRGNTPVGLLPANMPVDRAGTERSLADLARSHNRIWAVPGSWWDTDGIVEKWLHGHLHKVMEKSFRGVKLDLFSTD